MLSTNRKALLSLLQAAGLAIYCGAVATLMLNLPRLFGQRPGVAGVAFLLVLFVVSAMVSASMVLGYPAYLVMKGRIREGVHVVAWTAGWLVVFLVLAGAFLIMAR